MYRQTATFKVLNKLLFISPIIFVGTLLKVESFFIYAREILKMLIQ